VERYFLGFVYPPTPGRVDPGGVVSPRTLVFSNVNAAMRKETWERFPFAEDVVMSEDQEWAARVVAAGMSVLYEPDAAVFHSHDYSLATAFRRFFDSGASASRSYLAGGATGRRDLRRAQLAYARGELAFLRDEAALRDLPYTAVYELAKLVGLELGRRERLLPRALKRRLSATPQFWG
jgi:rhamnosyltransferase